MDTSSAAVLAAARARALSGLMVAAVARAVASHAYPKLRARASALAGLLASGRQLQWAAAIAVARGRSVPL
eukprot:11215066-Lingulodinium_polyedra.AAC.1